MSDRTLVIGIAGGTASGKSTLTQTLAKHFAGHVTVIQHDSYYKNNDHLPFEARTTLNYDAPTAFDNDLMIEQVKELISGKAVECPTYDYALHTRAKETVRLDPSPILIVEGILIFAEPRLCELCDIKLFVDTDADVRILRRIRRDVVERGRSLESVEAQYLKTVKPMHELYVEPSKRQADMIIPEGGSNLVALDMLVHRIDRVLGLDPNAVPLNAPIFEVDPQSAQTSTND
ncbi:uridine kinase [Boudabousia liubingyangii]|uniref:uridine kinase n=1 Tax=Boudabousia liubingyangii TaxID=1921764 RepID=UPI00093E175F|nr:uridine kinase [Boudabousia liubingyangii]OKL46092.1 uridine kinase [Boudabousia liubingyangii]